VLTRSGNFVSLYSKYASITFCSPVFLNRRAAARYRALASIIPGRERPEKTTICYNISLVQLMTNLYVILFSGFHRALLQSLY